MNIAKRRGKLLLVLILAFVASITLGMLSLGGWSTTAYAMSGSGTATDPYLISTKADMEEFRDKVNSGKTTIHGKLMADINLENRECIVYGKGDKERRVYFDAKAKVHLREYLKSRTDNDPALFVTLNSPHKRLKISGVEIRILTLGRSVSLERIHPHKFRRTMATRAIDKGMPIEQVQKILGHSQIDTTMQYAMVNQTNVKNSHQKIMG